ncbi:Integrin [Balamuthia mandrillaris]
MSATCFHRFLSSSGFSSSWLSLLCLLSFLVLHASSAYSVPRPQQRQEPQEPFLQQEALLKVSNFYLENTLGGATIYLDFGYESLSLRDGLLAVSAVAEASNVTGVYHGEGYPAAGSWFDSFGAEEAGAVWLFRRTLWGKWRQEAILKAHQVGRKDRFGWSVSVANADMVVVSTPFHELGIEGVDLGHAFNETTDDGSFFPYPPFDEEDRNYGSVYVFVRDDKTDRWRQEAFLGPPMAVPNGKFGYAVATADSGRTLVVGMPGENSTLQGYFTSQQYLEQLSSSSSSPSSGAVVVFRRDDEDEAGRWRMEAILKPEYGDEGDSFGISVAADGDTIIVGATGEDSPALEHPIQGPLYADPDLVSNTSRNCGAAYIFVRQKQGETNEVEWRQEAFLKPRSCADRPFGYKVALSNNTAVVTTGVHEYSTANELAWIFVRGATQEWRTEQLSTNATTDCDVRFCGAVALQDDVIICGAPSEGTTQPGVTFEEVCLVDENTGGAYLYQREEGADWEYVALMKASNSVNNPAYMGQSVAYHGGIIAAGAPFDSGDTYGVTNGYPGPTGIIDQTGPSPGAVVVFASNLHTSGECDDGHGSAEFLAFVLERGGRCVVERWLLYSSVTIEEDEVWRIEGETGVAVQGSVNLTEGGRIEFVVGSTIVRSEAFLYVEGCASLHGILQLDFSNLEDIPPPEAALPLIFEDRQSVNLTSDCPIETVVVEVISPTSNTNSNDKTKKQLPIRIEASLQRNRKFLEAVLTVVNVDSSSSSSSSSSAAGREDSESNDNTVVIPVVVSLTVVLLLLLLIGAAAFFIVRRNKRKQNLKKNDKDVEEGIYLQSTNRNNEDDENDDEEEQEEDYYDGPVPRLRRKDVEYVKEPVASGAFGVVYKGKWKGKDCAVKVCSAIVVDQQLRDEFIREAEIMHELGGKENYCTTLYGVMRKGKRMCLVTEWAEHGSAYDLLINPNKKQDDVSWLAIVKIARNAARGLRYLHSLNVVHRDIAARNVLVCHNFRAVLGDFGMSRVLEKMYQITKSNVGAVRWMAPEAFKDQKYSKETDSFSFGVFLWELCTRQQPWEGKDVNYVVNKVLYEGERLPIKENEDEVIKDLLERCWQSDPKLRPTAEELSESLDNYYRTLKKEAIDSTQRQNQVAGYMQTS